MPSQRAKTVKIAIKVFGNKNRDIENSLPKVRRIFDKSMKNISSRARGVKISKDTFGGLKCEVIASPHSKDRTILYIHGGGFVLGSIESYRNIATHIAKACEATVILPEYSLAPEHPFPKALNELEKCWNDLLSDKKINKKRMIIMGDSAGGNLTLTLTMKLRDNKSTLPKCIVLLYPAVDAHFSGESITERKDRDPLLSIEQLNYFLNVFAGSESKDSPYISPICGSLKGFPPMLVQTGTEEILYSDSVRITNKGRDDGVKVKLSEYDGMWHGWHMSTFVPESKSAVKEIGDFVKQEIN